MKTIFDRLTSAVKNWWMSLIAGILFIAAALWLMFAPAASYVILSILFSLLMFVSGIVEIVFAASNRHISSWGWYLAGGIIDLILGILLLAIPSLSMQVLPFVLAFWLMFRGFTTIGYGMDLHRYGITHWGWHLAFGILAVLCSLGILWQPMAGALTLVYLAAYALLVIGIFRIMLAFELRALYRHNCEACDHADHVHSAAERRKE